MPVTRRQVLLGLSAMLAPLPSWAAAEPALAQALRSVGIDPGAVRWGAGLSLTAPLIADDGSVVPVQARAESPMNAADHVTALHLFAPGNPKGHAASAQFGPAAGRAELGLRIRLAKSQIVAAIARHSDGRLVGALAEVRVTAGGCRT
jgi:sulfur-oxidizing protein SoxY